MSSLAVTFFSCSTKLSQVNFYMMTLNVTFLLLMFAREKISMSVSMSFVSPGKIIFNLIFSCNFCLCCCTFLFCLPTEHIVLLCWDNMLWCLFKIVVELHEYCRGCTGFQLALVVDIQRERRGEPRMEANSITPPFY